MTSVPVHFLINEWAWWAAENGQTRAELDTFSKVVRKLKFAAALCNGWLVFPVRSLQLLKKRVAKCPYRAKTTKGSFGKTLARIPQLLALVEWLDRTFFGECALDAKLDHGELIWMWSVIIAAPVQE